MRTLILAVMLAAVLMLVGAPALAETAPPPTPEDVAVRISGLSGQVVEVERGENIAVELQSSPSTGGRWTIAAKPDFLDDAGMQTGPVNAPAANTRPVLGAPVWNVFLFTANAAGSAPLTLELRGPGGQVWQTFTVTINAQ